MPRRPHYRNHQVGSVSPSILHRKLVSSGASEYALLAKTLGRAVVQGACATVEALEHRTFLSATYSNADVTGPWSVQAMNLAGTATFDGAGNITGGSFTKLDGSTTVPSGIIEIAPNGVASLTTNPPIVGGINSSKDVLAFSNIQTGNLTVGINSSVGGFSDANLKGTWYEFDNSPANPGSTGATGTGSSTNNNNSSGHGTITFDGAGGMSITHVQDSDGQSQTLIGTYTVSSSGVVVVNIPVQSTNNNALSFTGAINNSGDVIAADATNLPTAAATDNSLMLVVVQPVGSYSAADLNGTWAVCTDGGTGSLTFDGAGNVLGSFTNSSGLPQTEAGSYTVSATGAVSMSLSGVSSSGTNTTNLAGTFNASRNVVALDMPNSGSNGVDDLALLIGSGASLKTNISVQGSTASAAPGQAATFTATVTPVLPTGIVPSGSVTFFDGNTILGTGTIQSNGSASFTTTALTLGSHAITASYGGDAGFLTSTSAGIHISISVPTKVGGLDPTFGTLGVASHNLGITSTVGVVVQSDGKSVIAGIAGTAGSDVFALTRYNADGSVDTSFANGGVANTSFGGDDKAADVMLLANGDILVAGTSTTLVNGQATGSQFALAEYTSAGVLDTTFGNGTGQVLTHFSSTPGTLSNDVAGAVAVGPDGTIYVGGSSNANGAGNTDFAVAAYTSSGNPSPTFGVNGKVLLDFSGGNDSIASLVVGTNGELIAAGSAVAPSSGVSSVALAEFLPSGALDTAFGSNGKVITSVGGIDDAATALALDAKGNLIVGGYTATGSASVGTLSANFLLLRYTPAGLLDKTFASHGIAVTNFNQPAAISSVLVNADGSIVASGKTVSSLTNLNVAEVDLAVARYTAKGQLDTTFDGTGTAIISLAATASPQSLTSADTRFVEQSAFDRSILASPSDATSALMMEFNQLTQADQGIVATTPSGQLLVVGNNDGNTVEAAIITSGLDLAASMATALPQSVLGGAKGTASVSIAEAGTELAAGTFTIDLFVSSSQNLTTQQFPVQNFNENVSLKDGKSKSYHLKFLYPTSLADGHYFLVATVETGSQSDLNPANNTAVSTSSTLVAQPFVQLNGSGLTTPTFDGVKPGVVSFTIANAGNKIASTPSAVELFASLNGSFAGATPLGTEPLRLGLKPGSGHVFKVKASLPTSLPAGSYTLVALLDPNNVFGDPNAATNFIVSGSTFVAG